MTADKRRIAWRLAGLVLTGRLGVLSGYPFFGVAGIRPYRQRCRGPRVSIDEQPVALPKLYGAPAYARPPAPVAAASRPFDPDQLPLELYRTEEEEPRAASHPPAHAYTLAVDIAGDPRLPDDHGAASGLRPRAFSLRAIAGRLLGDD